MEHLAQTPGGFPDNLAPMSWPNAGPVNDATG
jgi:hypothetical protein